MTRNPVAPRCIYTSGVQTWPRVPVLASNFIQYSLLRRLVGGGLSCLSSVPHPIVFSHTLVMLPQLVTNRTPLPISAITRLNQNLSQNRYPGAPWFSILLIKKPGQVQLILDPVPRPLAHWCCSIWQWQCWESSSRWRAIAAIGWP